MASTVDLTLLGHPSSFPLPSTHSNAIGNDAVRDSSRRPPTPSPLSQPIVTSTPKSTAADESMQPSSEPGNDLTLSEQAFEAMGLLNRQEMQLGNNIKDARKQVIDAEASLALAKRNLKNAKDIQALNATAMRNKRLELSYYAGRSDEDLGQDEDFSAVMEPYQIDEPELDEPIAAPIKAPTTRKRRQEDALTGSDRSAPMPQAKRVARAASKPSGVIRVPEPPHTGSAPAARISVKPKPQSGPTSAIFDKSFPQAAHKSSSLAVKATPTRSKHESYHPDSYSLVPANDDSTKWIELRCCYCGGNTINHTEKRHMRGAKGFRGHLDQVHNHKLTTDQVVKYCTFREVPVAEVRALEETVRAGGKTHIEYLQSARSGTPKQHYVGGWSTPPDVAMGSASGAHTVGKNVDSDDYDVPKSDGVGPVMSALRSTLQNHPDGSAVVDDDVDIMGAPRSTAGKLKAIHRPIEL